VSKQQEKNTLYDPKLILAVAALFWFVAVQQLSVAHDLLALGDEHDHSHECSLCVLDGSVLAFASKLLPVPQAAHAKTSTLKIAVYSALGKAGYLSRAPPINVQS